MAILAWYAIKVITCSGILFGYYLLAYRNKIFHCYNRIYLLVTVLLSFLIPLIKIDTLHSANYRKAVVKILNVVSGVGEINYNYAKAAANSPDYPVIIIAVYLMVSIILAVLLSTSVLRIWQLSRKYQASKVGRVYLYNTTAKGTPYSFFNSVFWNTDIDINDAIGRQIFEHELVHIREKHSYDKLAISIILIFFWVNPFLWVIKKELTLIHEFIADKKAVKDKNSSTLAAMLLQSVYPLHNFSITSNFFYSSLKRRIMMLNKHEQSSFRYLTRLLALPLTALVFYAFTINTQLPQIQEGYRYLGKKVKVIIDAGHGGADLGAISGNGLAEKDIALAITQKIKSLRHNDNIDLIFSREGDRTATPRERVDISTANHADLFISIHLNSIAKGESSKRGLEIIIPDDDQPFVEKSKLFAMLLVQKLQINYGLPISQNLQQLNRSVLILKGNRCPSVLIEAGYISNHADLSYLTDGKNQEKIANDILIAIDEYFKDSSL